MRQANNGFVKFMCKLDGKPVPKPKRKFRDWTLNDLCEVLSVSIDDLEDAINGDREAIDSAFQWNSTPHGHYYWRSRWMGTERVSDRDYLFLE